MTVGSQLGSQNLGGISAFEQAKTASIVSAGLLHGRRYSLSKVCRTEAELSTREASTACPFSAEPCAGRPISPLVVY